MDIKIERRGDITIFRLMGRIDGSTVSRVEICLLKELREGHNSKFALDLAGVNFISGAGIRCLFVVLEKLKAINGAMAIFASTSSVEKLLQMTGLAIDCFIDDTEQEAIQHLSAANT